MPITSAIAIASTASSIVTGSFWTIEVEHRLLRPHRFAEVAAQHAADPVAVAHRQRIVEVQLLVQVGDDVRVALLAGEDDRRIAGQQLLQPEDQHRDEDQRRQDRRDALDEELDHGEPIVRAPTNAELTRHLQARDPQQPVRNAAHAAQLGVVRPQPVAVVQIDDRTILEDARGDLLEGLLARGRIGLAARRVEQLVDLGHAVAGVVERLLAGVEAVEVAVGIGTAAPGQDVGLEVALVGHVERGRELGRLDLDVEAGLARHRLDDEREPLRVGGRRRDEREARIRNAGLLEQRLGARDVALGHRHVLRIEGVARRDPLVADRRLVVHHDLDDAGAVERELERLAHLGVLAERVLLRLLALSRR
jgi:hypothetical protein